MSYEFQGSLYANSQAICNAVAYEWITAGGANTIADIEGFIAAGATAESMASECISGWELESQEGDEGQTWLEQRESSREELVQSFAAFLKTFSEKHASRVTLFLDSEDLAAETAIAEDQMWEDEATKYIFDDNSFIVFQGCFHCAVDADSAESLQKYRKFLGSSISKTEREEIDRLLAEIDESGEVAA